MNHDLYLGLRRLLLPHVTSFERGQLQDCQAQPDGDDPPQQFDVRGPAQVWSLTHFFQSVFFLTIDYH